MSEKNARFKNRFLLITAALVMGIIPLILFCTPVRDKILAEDRMFVLIFFEVVFFLLFLNLIYSNKKRLQTDAKTDKIKHPIYLKLGKYIAISLAAAVLSYVLSGYSNKLAVVGAFVPVALVWIYQTFKK